MTNGMQSREKVQNNKEKEMGEINSFLLVLRRKLFLWGWGNELLLFSLNPKPYYGVIQGKVMLLC